MQQDKYIRNLLEQLNAGKAINGYIVMRKLSGQVQLARIWHSAENEKPMDIYLLKEKDNYIGTAQEQETELYAYVSTAYRRKGVMKAALKETIIPHLLQRTPILRATISKSSLHEKMYIAGKHLAMASGFEILKEENGQCRLLLDGTKLQKRIFVQGENVMMSVQEKSDALNILKQSLRTISIAQCMLEYKQGRSVFSENLLDVCGQLRKLLGKF